MAVDLNSIVVPKAAGSFDASVPAPYGWVVGGASHGWDVVWSDGSVTDLVDEAQLVELLPPFIVGDRLGRKVCPSRHVDPDMIGVVVIQTTGDVLIVEAPAMTYAILKSTSQEIV